MRPSDWLAENLWPASLYVESKLDGLAEAGIRRTGEVLHGRWPLTGRHSSVPLMTPAEVLRFAAMNHLELEGLKDNGERVAFGFQIVTAVWVLVRPILVEVPPSAFQMGFEERAEVDLADIRRYGF